MKSGTQQLPENDMGPLAASDKLIDGSPSENLKDADELLLEDIRDQIRYIEKSVMTKEIYYMTRVVRGLSGIRRRLNCNVLRGLMQGYFPNPSPQKTYFLEFLPEAMDTDCLLSSFRPRAGKLNTPLIPEVEVYLHLLLVMFLIDENHLEEACKCSNLLMDRLSATGRRSMALLASRCYYYHSRSYELVGRLDSVRSFFHARLSTATLRSNFDTKAVLINLLLRNYLHYQLHEQAHKLVSRVVFPESAPNNEWARYLYYLGRIKAIQLDYSSAHEHLVSALRKAPQHTATGFKQTLHKLNTVVELLLGEQPDRSIFRQTTFKAALQPYFQLTQAIHAGDLSRFNDTLRVHGAQFSADKMYTLIIRLRHNVIKTGVRRISLSYSRISLADIAKKLQLDSVEDAEYIVAKAIRDGVIDAIINHKEGHVTTNETLDLYSTREPFNQFHQRIKFCLSIHNQAVKAMRYPPKQYSKDIESAEERREREQQELENAKELSEDEFDGFP
ncbi:26S proteasome regulatory subunit S3, putative [Schistosoma mansoni]|nr:26S proteasome regulatory subunit S3, putative [Schistosoma mansoni]|eukprot:XP_018645142.1 26S proteasome regulatory subunit S3, putative [Schistosoma mansoni]